MISLNNKSNLAKTALLYTTGALLLQGVNFAVAPLFTHILDVAQYGIAANYFFWTSLLGILVSVQFGSSLNNAYHKYGKKLKSYLMSIMLIYPIIATCILALVILFRDYLSALTGLSSLYLVFAVLNGFFIAVVNICLAYFICKSDRRHYLLVSISVTLLAICLSLFLSIVMEDKLLGRILGYFFGYFTVGLLCLWYIFKGIAFKIQRRHLIYAIGISAPLLAHELMYLIASQSNRVFLLNSRGAAAAGIFSLAFSMGSVSIVLASAINNAWTPWYFKVTKFGNDLSKINRAAFLMVSLFATAMSLVALFASDAISLIVPNTYSEGLKYIPIIILSGYFIFIFNIISNYIVLSHRTRLIPAMSFVSCAISVSLNIILIPKFGGLGAAIASLSSSIVLAALAYVVARYWVKNINLRLRSIILPTILIIFNVSMYYVFYDNLLFRVACGTSTTLLYAVYMARVYRVTIK